MNKQKHLEFLQQVITRMNTNSFMIKGWTVAILSALFVLSQKDTNQQFLVFAVFPSLVFWIMDGFYLSQEKQYRALYSTIARKKEAEIDFSMDARAFNTGDNTWIGAILSKTLIPFYGILIFCIVLLHLFGSAPLAKP